METRCQYLTLTQRNDSLKLLQKPEELFYGKHSTWKTDPVDFKINEEAKPVFSRPYPVPKAHEEIFKKEVEHLVLLGVLEVANYSEWGSQSFAQPKPKSNQVHFLIDFRNLNKQLNKNHTLCQK